MEEQEFTDQKTLTFESTNSAWGIYLKEVQKYPVLTKEENLALVLDYQSTKNKASQNKIIQHNLRLVLHILQKYKIPPSSILDVIQEGNIGLMTAVDKFDASKGVAFSSYAYYWIQANVYRFIMENHRLVKLGTTEPQRKIFWNLAKTRAKLEAAGLSTTSENLATELGVKESDIQNMQQRMNGQDLSLYDSEGKALPLESSEPNQSEMLEVEEQKYLLRTKLEAFQAALKPKAAKVFEGRFMCDEPLTFQEIAQQMIDEGLATHFTRQRVEQINVKLEAGLRQLLKRDPIFAGGVL